MPIAYNNIKIILNKINPTKSIKAMYISLYQCSRVMKNICITIFGYNRWLPIPMDG